MAPHMRGTRHGSPHEGYPTWLPKRPHRTVPCSGRVPPLPIITSWRLFPSQTQEEDAAPRGWTVHELTAEEIEQLAISASIFGTAMEYFADDQGPLGRTVPRALYGSSRLHKLSGMSPTVPAELRRPYQPYEEIRSAAARSAQGMLAGARPNALGLFQLVATAAPGAPRPKSATARAAIKNAGLRHSTMLSSSRLLSVGTSISALACEPPSGSMHAISDDLGMPLVRAAAAWEACTL